jgi:heme exporter protein B
VKYIKFIHYFWHMREILLLARKEFLIEFRERHAFGAIVLFSLAAVFVCYLGFRTIPNPDTWNALFWLIVLFSSFNALSRSFGKEERGLMLYLYTLADARSVIMGKLLYNALLSAVLTLLTFGLYALFMGRGVLAESDMAQLLGAALLGAIGMAGTLTLISGIAAKTGNVFGMMAVLGFPIVMPLLVAVLRLTRNALDGLAFDVNQKYFAVLIGLNILVAALSYLLFPYLWRD